MLGIDSLDEVIKEIKSDKREKDFLIQKISSDLIDEYGVEKIEIFNKEITNLNKQKTENELLIKKGVI